MSETYNPRERTFIKKPEIKLCPTCGHAMQPDVKPMTNIMNRYINPANGRMVTMNSGEDMIEQSGVKLYRCELQRNEKGEYYSLLIPKVPEPVKPVAPTPIVAPQVPKAATPVITPPKA